MKKHLIALTLVLGMVSGGLFAANNAPTLGDFASVVKRVALRNPVSTVANVNYFFGEPLSSVSRITHAKALTTETKEDFKKLQNIALGTEAAQAALYTYLGLGSGDLLALWYAYTSAKRAFMHRRYAKNAKLLHNLLQSEEFKGGLGVEDWNTVKDARTMAEVKATLASAWLPGLGTVFIKPFVARASRKKEGAIGLEDAFDKAIRERAAGYSAAEIAEDEATQDDESADEEVTEKD
ncbi:MAG: hypothetical protein QG604_692 [Candidatus Dependentiae bacterium]|nr:hypothetical protein [Candidatus Dependentiae bacterium]